LEILKKFGRIGPKDERFLGDHSFEKFLRISMKFFPAKFPRISPEYFSGNS